MVWAKTLDKLLNKENEANFFWVGDLTMYELANFQSFQEKGFIVNIWTYLDDRKNSINLDLLDKYNIKNAQHILDVSLLDKFTQGNQKRNMSSFSNIFRFELLKKYGGWWFDADCICLKKVDEFINLATRDEFIIGREYKDYTGSSVLFFNDKTILDMIIEEAWERIEEKNYNFYWGEIGPNLISEIFLRENLMQNTLNENYFYKISAHKFDLFFKKKNATFDIDTFLKDSYVAHYWNEMLNRALIKKDRLPPKDSYMNHHITSYLLEKESYKTYTKIFYIRFYSSFRVFVRIIYRIKVSFNNFFSR